MPSPQEAFINLIDQIVHEHMDEDQQTQFDIDGKEMISNLFSPGRKEQSKISGYSISPSSLEVFNATTGFGALVIACISLYIDMNQKKKKNAQMHEKLDKLALLNTLKKKLSENSMSPELIEIIDKKYGTIIIEILDDL